MKKTELALGTAAFLLTPAFKKLILQILRSVLKACYLAINLSLAVGGLRGILSSDGSWKSPVLSSIKFLPFSPARQPAYYHANVLCRNPWTPPLPHRLRDSIPIRTYQQILSICHGFATKN